MTKILTRCGNCQAELRGSHWYLCPECVKHTQGNLAWLYRREVTQGRPTPNLLDELAVTLTRQARITEPIGRGGAKPLVFHDLAASKMRALSTFLRHSARHYRIDAAQDVFSHTVRAANNPYGYAAWLHSHLLVDVVSHPDSPEFADRLESLIDEVITVIDRPAEKWFAGPCPVCGADLYAAEGAEMARCRTCRATVDVATQRETLLAAVDDVLATAAEIARAVHLTGPVDASGGQKPVTPSRITHLFHRGAVERQGQNHAGDWLYRVGDVLAALADTGKRQGA